MKTEFISPNQRKGLNHTMVQIPATSVNEINCKQKQYPDVYIFLITQLHHNSIKLREKCPYLDQNNSEYGHLLRIVSH